MTTREYLPAPLRNCGHDPFFHEEHWRCRRCYGHLCAGLDGGCHDDGFDLGPWLVPLYTSLRLARSHP